MTEARRKIERVRRLLSAEKLDGLLLRGSDWFSWATAGGTDVVLQTSERGVAQILITPDKSFAITNRIEDARLRAEELPPEFEPIAFPWQDAAAAAEFARRECPGPIASDRPAGSEIPLSPAALRLKTELEPEEISRYRRVGRAAAEAMHQALQTARPDWTERMLAAEGARELIRRGLDPALVLAAGQERVRRYRHPIPKDEPLGECAMLVFCARSSGLFANLTRFVYFREPEDRELGLWKNLTRIEARALAATRPGAALSGVYAELARAYADAGLPNEIDRHHQGGPTGYLSREAIAGPRPHASLELIRPNTAFAWNPSLPGAKVEDTFLLGESALECLTSRADGKRDAPWLRR